MADPHPMKIKAPAPWFGGKRTLAPTIVQELGAHTSYFEPFCGCAAVLFAKAVSKNETVNDLHWDLTNLIEVLASDVFAPQLYVSVQKAVVSDVLLERATEELAKPIDHCERNTRAYWYFVVSWMARNGLAGTSETNYQLAARWTAGGGSPAVRFRSAVDSIPAWHERLRNVVVLNRDAFAIIPKFEDAEHVAIYVDPPYPKETRSSQSKNSTKGHSGRYLHEFDDEGEPLLGGQDDHARLADMLREFKHARIVVSSYDCERIRRLYEGWTVRECTANKQLAQANARGNHRTAAPEILLMNGRSYAP